MEMTIGVFKTSRKENERRVPIYPEHLPWVPEAVRRSLFFERGYGESFGYPDRHFSGNCAGLCKREELFEKCDLLLLPKPMAEDLRAMRMHQVFCGWSHCVQQVDIAQAAIDRKLTLLSWEAMHHWSSANEKRMHIFYKNNELAGYSAVLHVLELLGMDGHYGPRRHVAIIGYGSVSRGAIYALQGRGFNNIHVYTRRPTHLVADQNPDVYYHNYSVGKNGQIMANRQDGTSLPLIGELSQADIICNGVLQDVDNPSLFVQACDIDKLKPRTIIIDISCDKGMGFSFASPTTFDAPLLHVGEGIIYYSVDHTPTYLWNAASREISRALIPFLSVLSQGSKAWREDPIISKAIDIEDGAIRNGTILSFQKRQRAYPYDFKAAGTRILDRA